MDQNTLIVAVLVTISTGGLLYALVYPYLSGDIKAQKRAAALVSSGSSREAMGRSNDPAKRRKAIADSLKEVETQNKKKRLTLEQRIAQAGLSVSREAFVIGSVVMGVVLGVLLYVTKDDALIAAGGLIVGAFGFPSWTLSYLRARRLAKFIDAFPGSIDVIIRGVKAGLPVADCFRVIATEGQEPVRSEFRKIIESTAVGLSIGEGTERFAERVPTAEASFFSIVINIQQKAGGNLSEALTNLSNVLRDRKKMKGKIKAMSSEAKASAGIIGSLPFLVGGAVYLTTPSYMMVLFTTNAGKFVMGGSLLWMAIGIFIMRKMISFDI